MAWIRPNDSIAAFTWQCWLVVGAALQVVVGSSDFDLQLLQQLEACCHISSSIPDLTIPPAALAQQQQQQQQSGVRGRSSPAVREAAHEASRSSAAAAAAAAAAARRGWGQQQQQLQQQQRSGAGSSSSSGAKRQRQQQLQSVLPHHVADLVLLQSCSSQQQLAPMLLQQLQQLADAALSGTEWSCRQRQLSCLPLSAAAGSQHEHHKQQGAVSDRAGNASSGSAGTNIWVVPPMDSSGSSKVLAGTANNAPEQQQLPRQLLPQLQQLTSKLLAWPRSSSSSSGCFSRPLSEREWLKAAERVWEAVQGSRELLQYYQAAAEARYIAAGGWRQR
jgi:hypothetical protein